MIFSAPFFHCTIAHSNVNGYVPAISGMDVCSRDFSVPMLLCEW